jgi:hypothetical protein
VRLRHAYVIKCDEVIKDANGEVIELKCSIDPETLGKNPEGRKVKGVIHWVSATKGVLLKFVFMIVYLQKRHQMQMMIFGKSKS